MKRVIILAALLAAALFVSFGHAVAASAAETEKIIRQIEQDWMDALLKADVAAVDKFVTPDWQITDPEGNLITKADADADLKSGAWKYESVKLVDLQVRVYGDTAVAFGLDTEKSSYKGNDTSGSYRWTDVFVKINGTWKAVTTHVTKVVKH